MWSPRSGWTGLCLLVAATWFLAAAGEVAAADLPSRGPAAPGQLAQAGGDGGQPLPRFVSLRADKVNLRSGPGIQYPIDWVYHRRNLPVEVIQEFEAWRRVRDWEGTVGWVHKAMLHGRRTVMVVRPGIMRLTPDDRAVAVARLSDHLVGDLRACKTGWCQVEIQGYRGWLPNGILFGLNEGERRF